MNEIGIEEGASSKCFLGLWESLRPILASVMIDCGQPIPQKPKRPGGIASRGGYVAGASEIGIRTNSPLFVAYRIASRSP